MTHERDIMYETAHYWVLRLPNGHFGVYQSGITHSVRCGYFGYEGDKGLRMAITYCDRREAQHLVRL